MKLGSHQEGGGSSRLTFLIIGFFLFGLILIFRLFVLQILNRDLYQEMASDNQEVSKSLFPQRGTIYAKELNEVGEEVLFPLVTNQDYNLVYAVPSEIIDAKKIIDGITPILGLEEEEWKDTLSRISKDNDPYEPIAHKVNREQVEQLIY